MQHLYMYLNMRNKYNSCYRKNVLTQSWLNDLFGIHKEGKRYVYNII